jgi:hypothetical protein
MVSECEQNRWTRRALSNHLDGRCPGDPDSLAPDVKVTRGAIPTLARTGCVMGLNWTAWLETFETE